MFLDLFNKPDKRPVVHNGGTGRRTETVQGAVRTVTKSVTWKAEKEEEEMIRLAIEASLADDKPPDHSHLNHVLVNAREIAQGSLYASTDEAQQ